MPCGVKNNGTINHIESNPRINTIPCASNGLAAITNVSTIRSGVPTITSNKKYIIDSKIVCKSDWPNRLSTERDGSVTARDTQRKNNPPHTHPTTVNNAIQPRKMNTESICTTSDGAPRGV